ncbi:ATP-dependent Clp protease adaptor ClpS [Alphaproteobacteria bacterium]|nr:ATP-dependent Clp protease adaptor ClpS [Alphaproteobacteria bacterium]
MTKKNKKIPSSYHVILMGDDRTPPDFLAEVLITLFQKQEEALNLIVDAQEKGEALCGTYSLEIAETKSAETIEWARRQEFPLQCRMEKA